MDALDGLNNSQFNVTPSRKRKRQFRKFELEENVAQTRATTSCFTNAAFSSTPKKYLVKRRVISKKRTENCKVFPNVGLETKSITEIAKDLQESCKVPRNPYEVQRKPPKKKRHTEDTACFENPALNLELPDKLFNPYEVVRDATTNKSPNCFANRALNLKVQDLSVLRNPFEVERVAPNRDLGKLHGETKVQPVLSKSFAMSPEAEKQEEELTSQVCQFKLGLPFIPRVGCRIDFNDISISQLTPTKLLADKLVFSPVPKGKVSLGSIGEETTMDIGKELDRYQLELENSINEAKLRKTGTTMEEILLSPPDATWPIQIFEHEKRPKFTQKLSGILEDSENEQNIGENNKENEHHSQVHVQKELNTQKVEKNVLNTNPFRCGQQYERTETAEVVEIENLEESFSWSADDQEDEDSFDFKTPAAPFVRAYTKPIAPSIKPMKSEEALESNISDKSGETDDHIKRSLNVKNIIRKSIRKLMHSHQQSQPQEIDTKDDPVEKPEYGKNNGFMNAIRQSLRRKPVRNLDEETVTKENEISIIDSKERTMKLKSNVLQTEYVKIEDLTNERKHSLRNSIRKSTREVRNHFLKSVFHKKYEEYDCHK